MLDQVTFIYEPHQNGPLEPRVRQVKINLAKVAMMIEDRDAQSDLTREPDLWDFPDWSYQFFGANVAAEDTSENNADTDDELDYVDIDWDLSSEECDELEELNLKHNTEFYRPEDLMTLRRLDGLHWVKETYGEGDVLDAYPSEDFYERDDRADEYPNLSVWFEVDEVAIPSQSNTQHDDYIKVLGWNADKCNRSWFESHGNHGRKNTFWRRAIRQNRGHRRQFWGESLSETQDYSDHMEEILHDHLEFESFRAYQELCALDQAYHSGEFGFIKMVHYVGPFDYLDDDYKLLMDNHDWFPRDDWFMDSMSQDESLPAVYDEEDERRRQEELDFASMVPTEEDMRALEEAYATQIDLEDEEVESRTFAHSGGMIGKKAVLAVRKQTLRVHDFA